MAAKLVDVARHAGVSVGTVSNVLNHPERVSPAVRENVHQSIRELGYVRNLNASALRSGVPRVVAMVVVDIGDPFFSLVAAHVERELADRGLLFTLSSTNSDPARERSVADAIDAQSLRGIILMPTSLDMGTAQRFRESGIPVVLFDHPYSSPALSAVAADDVAGTEEVTSLLLDLGHRRIGFVNGPEWASQAKERYKGVVKAIQNHPAGERVSLQCLNSAEWTAEAGRTQTELLMTGDEARPTAIICGNDMLALGAVSQLTQSGYAIPGDVSVVGFDDLPISRELPVPLTTVHRSAKRLAEAAVELLLSDEYPQWRLVATSLVVRDSTGLVSESGKDPF